MNWVTQCICCVPGTLGKWSCSKPDDLRGRNLPNICCRERFGRGGGQGVIGLRGVGEWEEDAEDECAVDLTEHKHVLPYI